MYIMFACRKKFLFVRDVFKNMGIGVYHLKEFGGKLRFLNPHNMSSVLYE